MTDTLKFTLLAAGALALAACGGETLSAENEEAVPVKLASFDDVTPEQWAALSSRRLFFGHQSVGRNMLAGVRTILEENPAIRLTLANAENPGEVEGPALIEANIGRNRQPATKADAFESVLETGFGSEPGAVAMYKYCYIDIQPETDPDELFEDYVSRTEAIEARYPDLTLVHITLPLVVTPTGPMESINNFLGRDTQTKLNLKRNHFNERMRAKYGGTDPLFDLAAIESLKSDGTRSHTVYRGQKVYRMAPEWTSDGGHLNEAGQRRVAEQFLSFLATLPDRSSAAAGAAAAGSE